MILYCKIGSMPGKHYKIVSRLNRALRKAPVVGQFFSVKDPDPRERYANPEGVRLLEIRSTGGGTLYVCERF